MGKIATFSGCHLNSGRRPEGLGCNHSSHVTAASRGDTLGPFQFIHTTQHIHVELGILCVYSLMTTLMLNQVNYGRMTSDCFHISSLSCFIRGDITDLPSLISPLFSSCLSHFVSLSLYGHSFVSVCGYLWHLCVGKKGRRDGWMEKQRNRKGQMTSSSR